MVDPELLQTVVDAEAAAKGHGGEEGDDIDGDAWMSAMYERRLKGAVIASVSVSHDDGGKPWMRAH